MTIKQSMSCCLIVGLLLTSSQGLAQGADEAPPADAAAPELDVIDHAIARVNADDNALTIDRADRSIDVETTVCLRSAEFLEMFVCTPDTREHESILVTDASPSMIHLALVLLGQEPGTPLSYDRDFSPPRLIPATGPEVRVFIVIDLEGVELEVPANHWIRDNQTGQMMQGNTWLFAGSQIEEVQGNSVYSADINGSAISLVNFGDDLLTLANELTQDNDSHDQVWAPRTEAIPDVGSRVTLRLRVEASEQADGTEGAGEAENTPPREASE